MATKYYRLKLQGEPSADEIHRNVGKHGGLVMRVHREKGETHVYYAGAEGGDPGAAGKGAEGASEVSLDEVTKLG
jgi:hypothetical protein